MSKRINKAKLKAMGLARVNAVCVHHAEIAVKAQETGDRRKFNRHCALLDQCAAAARELKGLGPTSQKANVVVNNACL